MDGGASQGGTVTAEAERAAAVSIKGLAKSFGSTVALDGADLEVLPGEVHALVGENGSGKSTLVKILSGVHRPDRGSLTISGVQTEFATSPRLARELGIATVFQEVLSIEARTVLENVWLGNERFGHRIPYKLKRERARAALAELLQLPPDLDALAEELSLSDRQACGIVRAILRQPKVLILDEATSALDYETRTRLFAAIRRLSTDGTGVVLITHKMDEIDEIGDRVTVMRSGISVGTVKRGEWNDRTLVRLMTGTDHLVQGVQSRREAKTVVGQPVLQVKGLRLRSGAAPIDLTVNRGELIGVAGLEGHGQNQFIRALLGGSGLPGQITIRAGEKEVEIREPRQAERLGVVYVPRDRRTESIFEWMSIRENFVAPTISRDAVAGIVDERKSLARFRGYVDRLKIKLGSPSDAITTLSGGNQQKVIIARWLATDPKVLMLNDPTRGIDINAKRDLYKLLTQLASEGMAVIMLSTEVDEHVELMDRVLVFREQSLSSVLEREQLSRETLVASFFGNPLDGGHSQ